MVRRRRSAQVAIEIVLAFIAAGILFVGILRTWSGLVTAMVQRQRNFDKTRVTAATPEPAKAGSLANLAPKKISILKE